MADNINLNATTSDGADLRTTEDDGLKHHQHVILELGAGNGNPEKQVSDSNPVPVSDAGESLTVDGPLTDAELRATPVTVDGSGVTQPVSAVSLPLPTGAATAAAQLPDGHNVTVDNVGGVEVVQSTAADLNCTEASAADIKTAVEAIQSGQLADGHNVTVDNASIAVTAAALPLPSGAALDAILTGGTQKSQIVSGATVLSIAGLGVHSAAATYQVDESGNVLGGSAPVQVALSSVQVNGLLAHDAVDGSSYPIKIGGRARTAEPAAVADADRVNAYFDEKGYQHVKAHAVGDVDVTSVPSSIQGPGNPTVDSYGTAPVNLAANTANQSIISAPGASKQIWIYGLFGSADVAGTISIQDEDDTAGSGVMPVAITGGFVMNPSGNFAMPWFKFATNKAVEIDTVTCTFDGVVTYAIVSV